MHVHSRTHTCTLLLITSSLSLWAIVLQTSGVIRAVLLSGCLALPLSDFIAICFESSAIRVQRHLFTISTYEPWSTVVWVKSGWNRWGLCSEWKRAAASPRCTFQPSQRLTHREIQMHTHTDKLTSFCLTLHIVSSSKCFFEWSLRSDPWPVQIKRAQTQLRWLMPSFVFCKVKQAVASCPRCVIPTKEAPLFCVIGVSVLTCILFLLFCPHLFSLYEYTPWIPWMFKVTDGNDVCFSPGMTTVSFPLE